MVLVWQLPVKQELGRNVGTSHTTTERKLILVETIILIEQKRYVPA